MYQLDNYVRYKGKEKYRVYSIQHTIIELIDEDDEVFISSYSNVSGIPLTEAFFTSLGWKPTHRSVAMLHIKLFYTFTVNGKNYHLHGHEYSKGALWAFNGMVVRYFHELQNMFSVIDPSHKFSI